MKIYAERQKPAKSFFNLDSKQDVVGYFQTDEIFGELTCATCYYQAYGRKKIEKHVLTKHIELITQKYGLDEPSSEDPPYSEDPPSSTEATEESPTSIEPKPKPTPIIEPNIPKKSKASTSNGFICKNKILGEMVCVECGYTTFQRSTMVKHVKNKHGITQVAQHKEPKEKLDDGPKGPKMERFNHQGEEDGPFEKLLDVLEALVPSPVSPINCPISSPDEDKTEESSAKPTKVTFDDSVASFTYSPCSSPSKKVKLEAKKPKPTNATKGKKRPYVYDGSDIVKKLLFE